MQPLDASLLQRIDAYIEDLFVLPDPSLSASLTRARAAGLPSIHVSPAQGKLLFLLAKIARAGRVLEIGTLGGYSTAWLARALPKGGSVVTLELASHHARVARESLAGVAPGVTIEIREGDAAVTLRGMIAAAEPAFDFVFIDADKPRYLEYLDLSLQLSRPGTVILADNVIRHGDVLNAHSDDANARGARSYNAAIAAHPRLESLVLPILRDNVDGLSISIVKD